VPDHFYVYPSYLRSKASRAAGRRVPTPLALSEVTAEEIADAARRLGFTAEAEPGKLYPREAHRFEGRAKITKKGGSTKTTVLKQIAEMLKADAARRAGE
jgi:signal recognition particle subunit SEC65